MSPLLLAILRAEQRGAAYAGAYTATRIYPGCATWMRPYTLMRDTIRFSREHGQEGMPRLAHFVERRLIARRAGKETRG